MIFNDRRPKICVTLTVSTENQILYDIKSLKDFDYDLVELRIDYYENVEDFHKVLELIENIKKYHLKPLLFTFRTKKEGGVHEMSEKMYFELNYAVIESKLIDLIDIELFSCEEKIKDIIKFAHENDVKVIMSNHDFNKTPPKKEIVKRLKRMQNLNADITKIAVMPNNEEDVLTLMEATLDMKKEKADRPFITISMGSMGIITRLTGELTGSCLTFAALNNISAPGQINVRNARELLSILRIKNTP